MKSLADIKTIGIAGAGTMGTFIAWLMSDHGFLVLLSDLNERQIEKAKSDILQFADQAVKKQKLTEEKKIETLSRINYSVNPDQLKADFIIEAIIEKTETKQDLFQKLASNNDPDTIFATNTSTIPVTRIAFGIENPERVVGMHFFNPPHLMKLVEVISGAATANEVAVTTKQLAEKVGKTVVMVKDSPGFIVNRVARHYYIESLKTLEENVADHEVIDALMEATGFRMGPFKLMDFIGNDTNFAVTKSLYESFHFDSKFRPNRIQQQKVESGQLGRKSGKGFYKY